MTILETMEARLTDLRTQSQALYDQRGAILDLAAAETRGATPDELAAYDEITARRNAVEREIAPVAERVTELRAAAEREAASATLRAETGTTSVVTVRSDPPVYAKGKNDTSFFRDLYHGTQKGDPDALDRLRRNNAATLETRALGNTGGAGGSGGEWAPPDWLVDQAIMLARPGRVAADLFDKQELPSGVSSINIPKVSTGTTTAIQTTQNTALSQTDITTTSISAGIATIGGKQVVSQQLLDQSAVPFDSLIMEDLALAYAGALDIQALTGAGTAGTLRGLASAAGITSQVYTNATPAVTGAGQFWAQIAKAIAAIYATRFLAPDTILMSPRRWAWITAATDTAGRPLVVPQIVAYNPIATNDVNVAQGRVGQLQGLDVYVDPNIPTNVGGTQDVVYIFRRGDIKLWETSPRAESFTQTYADTAGVLFRLYGYAALVPDRYGSSIVSIGGTGLAAPIF